MRRPPLEAPLRAFLLVHILAAGCVYVPVNEPIDHIEPDRAATGLVTQPPTDVGDVWMVMAFSGGGTRAAAFAYGVLEELRDTEIGTADEPKPLLAEVDAISGVSGGSFPAAYYGLFGERIFEDFEETFLRRNVQRDLFLRALIPWNLVGLMTPALSRSVLASRYYDEHVFQGSTFERLLQGTGPRIRINATDLTGGERFTFTEMGFDAICSDLPDFPVSAAVAASSAVPGLLSPLTLRNYAGRCGFQPPPWFIEALNSRETSPRRYRLARQALPFLDSETKRYIHLVDGGISDNLGMRFFLDQITGMGDIERARELAGIEVPDHLLVIVVNAETEPDPLIDLDAAAPGLGASMNLVSGAQIRRYNFETLQLTYHSVEEWARTLSRPGHPVTGHTVEVSFDLVDDEEERTYLKRLPTSFALDDEEIDVLIDAARAVLRESPDFQRALEALH